MASLDISNIPSMFMEERAHPAAEMGVAGPLRGLCNLGDLLSIAPHVKDSLNRIAAMICKWSE